MAEDFVTARPYAKALFEVAQQHKNLSHWSNVLQILVLIAADQNVEKFLTDPRINWQQRADLFIDVCGKKIDIEGKNLIHILAQNRRLSMLPTITAIYEEFRAAAEGVIKARVISAITLSATQQQKLQSALKQRLHGKEPALEYEQDESILGGLKIHIKDTVIDASIRGSLNKLKQNLMV